MSAISICHFKWLSAAAISFVVCGLIFQLAPRFVTRLLSPYAVLTYKNKKDKDSRQASQLKLITIASRYKLGGKNAFKTAIDRP